MQTVSQATQIVSYVTGTHRGRADQIARALINSGILPKSSGRDIKKIGTKELLPLVAAVALAETVADAPNIAKAFIGLPVQGLDTDGGPSDLAHFFAKVMDTSKGWEKPSLEFAKVANGYTANITGEVMGVQISLPFWRNASWGHFCKTSFTISPEGVEIMRNLFDRDDVEGMTFSLPAKAASE